ncbi:MAG: SRPBCC family protein [Polyangiales bacterium]
MRPPSPLDIADDLRLARTPPAPFYRDPDWFRWQREALFAHSWQLAPALAEVPAAGDVAPFSLLPGALDEPLLAARDGASLRCLSNTCTHRGMELVAARTSLATIRCGYHGRRFGLDGKCRAAPGFDAPCETDHLREAAVAHWDALPFAAVDPLVSFDAWCGDARARLASLPIGALVRDPSGDRSFTVAAHWALYVENYLEGFHVPFVHPGLMGALDLPSYRTELFTRAVLQVGAAPDGDALLPPDPARPGDRNAALYLWLFPNTMLNFYPWGLSVNVVVPVAPDRTRVDYLRYVWDAAQMGRGAGGDLDTVEREDDAVVEAVHRGLASRLYGRGRYAPGWEAGTHAFHRMVAAAAGSG